MPDNIGGNRFSRYTDQNHSAIVWIWALLTLTYLTIVFILRCLTRRKQYRLDDLLVALATFLATGVVAAIMVALVNGFGQVQKTVPPALLSRSNRAFFVSQILFIASCTLAKLATICLLMRLFSVTGPRSSSGEKRYLQWSLCLFLCALTIVWGLASSIGLGVNCPATSFVLANDLDSCPNQAARWQYITGFDVAIEAMIVILCLVILIPEHLARKNKIQVLFAFSLRLPIIALSVLHLHYIESYLSSTFPGLALATVAIFQLAQLCWSVISATIPTLKAFVQSFYTAFGSFTVGPASSAIFDSNESRKKSVLLTIPNRDRLGRSWVSPRSTQGRRTAVGHPPVDTFEDMGTNDGEATEGIVIDFGRYNEGHAQITRPRDDIELIPIQPQTQRFVHNSLPVDDEIRSIPPNTTPVLVWPASIEDDLKSSILPGKSNVA